MCCGGESTASPSAKFGAKPTRLSTASRQVPRRFRSAPDGCRGRPMPGGNLDQRETKKREEAGGSHATPWRRGAGCVWDSESTCAEPGMTPVTCRRQPPPSRSSTPVSPTCCLSPSLRDTPRFQEDTSVYHVDRTSASPQIRMPKPSCPQRQAGRRAFRLRGGHEGEGSGAGFVPF